ncbi:Fc.00g024630.m01.CDS01 [Cosmosporella sp. VM-42]
MTEVDDAHISVRFKHGIHTIYLFVDALAPFSAITTELLEILQERYPNGLTTSIAPPKTTAVSTDATIMYGVLSVPNDISRGWKKLKIGNGESTPTKLGLKNNSLVAFAFVDDEDDEVDFEVEWPKEDEELYEQA